MDNKLGFTLILIGIVSFTAGLIIWLWFYPKRKRFLDRLRRELNLECPEGSLIFRKSKLKGTYRDREIKIVPFVSEAKLWILVKFFNPKDFLASIKPRRPGMFLSRPISKRNRKELFTGNTNFDSQFKVLGTATPEIQKILPSSVQKKIIQLSKKENFEIQILHDGISYVSESRIRDVSLAKFILDLLIDIAENITFI